ncbi:MAG: threonine/serine dehydratase [Planctomycetota bacterium]
MHAASPPSIVEIEQARARLGDRVRETPVWEWREGTIEEALGPGTRVFLKMELFQYAGSFKPRGALTNMLQLSDQELAQGVTTVSAGNHAMATGYAARVLGTTAKVVMPKSANPARIQACREYGAEVVLVDDVHLAFEEVRRIEREEGRAFVHPFEGPFTALGTATLGFEFCRQVPDLEAVVIPIGGGGLCAGVSAATKLLQPKCKVYGVEPEGADTMRRSFASGKPEALDQVQTIADSLGAPHAAPYSFSLCRQFVDDLVLVDDASLCRSMAILFREMKLAVEPAGAAATAALLGPLRERLRGRRVGLIVCGANTDLATFTEQVQAGMAELG